MKLVDFNKIDINSYDGYKKKIAKRLKELSLPSKKSEEYRYFNIEALLNREYKSVDISLEDREIRESSKVIIEDGVVVAIPKGVDILVGCSNVVDVDLDHFDPLYFLGHLFSKEVISIRIKDNVDIEIEHRFTKSDSLISYRVAIYADSGIEAQIFESFKDIGKDFFVLSGYDLFISKGAKVKFIKNLPIEESRYNLIFSNRIKVDKEGEYRYFGFDFGDGESLELNKVELHQKSRAFLNNLLFIKNSGVRGAIFKVIHIDKESHTFQNLKAILKDNSRVIFDGLIKVENSALYSVAHQNSKAILLNDGAYMISKPQLEIYIDELEASHGSTTGSLDEEQIFYLRARGINLQEAKKMLIVGFANEMIEEVDDSNLKEVIHASFEKSYYGKHHLECLETCHGCEG